MKATILTTALVALSAVFVSPVHSQTAMPDSLEMSLSVTSINNIATLMSAILPQYIANNKTIDINYNTSTWTYSVEVYDLHIDNLVINTFNIAFLPGAANNTIRTRISGVNLASNFNASITVGLITVHGASLNITNLTAVVDLLAVPLENDTVKWQLVESSFMDLEDITLLTTSSIINAMIAPFHGVINSLVKASLPVVQSMISGAVQDLNKKLLNGTSFLFNMFDPRFLLNLTTTQPPRAD